MTTSTKKGSIFYVLKVLSEYSDENHFLTLQEIIDLIKKDYGVVYERKSVSNSIQLLKDLDFDINKGEGNKGVALFVRLFDASQITFITDAVFSSKSITGKDAIKIVNLLNSTLSKYARKNYSYIKKSIELTRTSNTDMFYNIDIISECINERKRVSFQYLGFDDKGKANVARDGYRYYVSPYYLANNFGRYYLICNYREKYGPISIFRVDHMLNIEIGDKEKYLPLSSFKEMENFDISKYLNEHVYLFGSKVVEAKILINDKNGIKYIDDRFGSNTKIKTDENNQLYTYIKCSEDALYYRLLQYGDHFTLLSPNSLIERLKEHYENQIKKY